MTRQEAREIIKTRVPTKYSHSAEMLLLHLVNLTYRGPNMPDDVNRDIKATTVSLTRAARVQARQLANIVRELVANNVLQDASCGVKYTTCILNVEPLRLLDVYSDQHKADKKEQARARSAKARERLDAQREASRIANAVDTAINTDAREFTIKSELLKDVIDQNLKRQMMNWDIERIKRAKTNADAALRDSIH